MTNQTGDPKKKHYLISDEVIELDDNQLSQYSDMNPTEVALVSKDGGKNYSYVEATELPGYLQRNPGVLVMGQEEKKVSTPEGAKKRIETGVPQNNSGVSKEYSDKLSKMNFVQRFNQPEKFIKNADGTQSTHRMASASVDGKQIAFPTIVEKNGKLVELTVDQAIDYAMKTGEYAEFATEKDAQWYAEGGYKQGTKLASGEKTTFKKNEGSSLIKVDADKLLRPVQPKKVPLDVVFEEEKAKQLRSDLSMMGSERIDIAAPTFDQRLYEQATSKFEQMRRGQGFDDVPYNPTTESPSKVSDMRFKQMFDAEMKVKRLEGLKDGFYPLEDYADLDAKKGFTDYYLAMGQKEADRSKAGSFRAYSEEIKQERGEEYVPKEMRPELFATQAYEKTLEDYQQFLKAESNSPDYYIKKKEWQKKVSDAQKEVQKERTLTNMRMTKSITDMTLQIEGLKVMKAQGIGVLGIDYDERIQELEIQRRQLSTALKLVTLSEKGDTNAIEETLDTQNVPGRTAEERVANYFTSLLTADKQYSKKFERDPNVNPMSQIEVIADAVGTVLNIQMGMTPMEKEGYFGLQEDLNAIAPVVMLRRLPVNQDTAGEVYLKTFAREFVPATRINISTAQQVAQKTQSALEYVSAKIDDAGQAETLKEISSPYENFSSKDWATMMGTTTAIMADMVLATPATNVMMKYTKFGRFVDKASDTGKVFENSGAPDLFFDVLGSNKFGRGFTKVAFGSKEKGLNVIDKIGNNKFVIGANKAFFSGVKEGIRYEIAGTTFQTQEDELNFMSGFFGGLISSPVNQIVDKKGTEFLQRQFARVFGSKSETAIMLTHDFGKALGGGIKSTGRGFAEVFEEFGNEIGNLYRETDNWDEVAAGLQERFGDTSELFHFAVSSFVMGAGMSMASSIGQFSIAQSKVFYNQLSPEEKAKFTDFATQFSSEMKDSVSEFEAQQKEADKAEVEQQPSNTEEVLEEIKVGEDGVVDVAVETPVGETPKADEAVVTPADESPVNLPKNGTNELDLDKGNKVQWNVFGNEEIGEWTVGEKTKTRGGKDAVVLTKVYVTGWEDGKSYTKEYADKNGITYKDEHTVEHIVPLSDLETDIVSETPIGESEQVVDEVVEPINKPKSIKLNSSEVGLAEMEGQKKEDVYPTRQFFENESNNVGLPDVDSPKFDEFVSENKDNTKEETIDLSEITPTQELVDKSGIGGKLTSGNPKLVRFNDGIFVLDGHHRISTEAVRGNTKIKADVTTIDMTSDEWHDQKINKFLSDRQALKPEVVEAKPIPADANESEIFASPLGEVTKDWSSDTGAKVKTESGTFGIDTTEDGDVEVIRLTPKKKTQTAFQGMAQSIVDEAFKAGKKVVVDIDTVVDPKYAADTEAALLALGFEKNGSIFTKNPEAKKVKEGFETASKNKIVVENGVVSVIDENGVPLSKMKTQAEIIKSKDAFLDYAEENNLIPEGMDVEVFLGLKTEDQIKERDAINELINLKSKYNGWNKTQRTSRPGTILREKIEAKAKELGFNVVTISGLKVDIRDQNTKKVLFRPGLTRKAKVVDAATAMESAMQKKNNGEYDLGEDVDEGDYYKETNDPFVIAQAITQKIIPPGYKGSEAGDNVNTKDHAIADNIAGLNTEWFLRDTDRNTADPEVVRSYTTKDGTEAISDIARNASAALEKSGDEYNESITVDDVESFMNRYPRGVKQYYEQIKKPQFIKDYEEKFELETGIKATPENIQMFADAIAPKPATDSNDGVPFSRAKRHRFMKMEELSRLVDLLSKTGLQGDIIYDQESFDRKWEEGGYTGKKADGMVIDGVIYINPATVKADTLVHEFGHLWQKWAKQKSPVMHARGMKLIKDSQYYDDIKNDPNYAHLTTEEQILDEALARAIGDAGAKLLDATKIEKFGRWMDNLLRFVVKSMGVSVGFMDEVGDMTLEEFTTKVARALSGDIVDMYDGTGIDQTEPLGAQMSITPEGDEELIKKRRRFDETMENYSRSSRLRTMIIKNQLFYQVESNEEALEKATGYINRNGVRKSFEAVTGDPKNYPRLEEVSIQTVRMILIDTYSDALTEALVDGDTELSQQITDQLMILRDVTAKQATLNGRESQRLSIWKLMSPIAVVHTFQEMIAKANAEVVNDPAVTKEIQDLAKQLEIAALEIQDLKLKMSKQIDKNDKLQSAIERISKQRIADPVENAPSEPAGSRPTKKKGAKKIVVTSEEKAEGQALVNAAMERIRARRGALGSRNMPTASLVGWDPADIEDIGIIAVGLAKQGFYSSRAIAEAIHEMYVADFGFAGDVEEIAEVMEESFEWKNQQKKNLEKKYKATSKGLMNQLKEIVQDHYSRDRIESLQAGLQERIQDELGLSEDESNTIAEIIENDIKQKAEKAARSIIEKTTLSNLPKAKNKKKPMIDHLVDNLMASQHTGDTNHYINVVMAYYGAEQLTKQEEAHLMKLAANVRAQVPGSIFYSQAVKQMAEFMVSKSPKSFSMTDAWIELYYASMLSGPSTSALNVASVVVNEVLQPFQDFTNISKHISLMKKGVKQDSVALALMPDFILRWAATFSGFVEGFQRFRDTMTFGSSYSKYIGHLASSKGALGVRELEKNKYKGGRFMGGKLNPWNSYKYVPRFLDAQDSMNRTIIEARYFAEMIKRKMIAEGKSEDTIKSMLQLINGKDIDMAVVNAQVQQEAARYKAISGNDLTKNQMAIRKNEIIREQKAKLAGLSQEQVEDVVRAADIAVFTGKRNGVLGKIATYMGNSFSNSRAKRILSLPWVPFVNVVANVFEFMMDATPVYGFARAYGYSPSAWVQRVSDFKKGVPAALSPSGFIENSAQAGAAGSLAREKQLGRAWFGTVAFGALAMLFLPDDDDDNPEDNYFRITGSRSTFNENDPAYTIYIGDFKLKYINIPVLSIPLSILGNYSDRSFGNAAIPDKEDRQNRLALAMLTLGDSYDVLLSMSFVSGVKDISTTTAEVMRKDPDNKTGFSNIEENTSYVSKKIMDKYLGLVTKPLPTNFGLVKQIEQIFDPTVYTRDDVQSMLWYSIGLERLEVSGVQRAYDIFGEEVQRTSFDNMMAAQAYFGMVKETDKWQLLIQNNIVPDKAKNVNLKFDDSYRKLTQKEWAVALVIGGQNFSDWATEAYNDQEYLETRKKESEVKGTETYNGVQVDILENYSNSMSAARQTVKSAIESGTFEELYKTYIPK